MTESNYTLEADEPMYVRTSFNEKIETENQRIDSGDGLEYDQHYYWITSTDRDEVLKVDNFMEAEQIIKLLADGTFESFEEVTEDEEYEVVTEIRSERPPY